VSSSPSLLGAAMQQLYMTAIHGIAQPCLILQSCHMVIAVMRRYIQCSHGGAGSEHAEHHDVLERLGEQHCSKCTGQDQTSLVK
jgi:hypothetical protein